MDNRIRRPIATLVAAACGLGAAGANAAIGARVLVQEWSPLAPDSQSVRIPVDQPNIVSDSLNRAWSSARVDLCKAITAQLGVSRAAAGQTLRDIDCNLDPNVTLDLRQSGINNITATLTLPNNSITATSTQPTVCGSECDPRFSLTARAQVMLGIAVQGDPNRPLLVTSANLVFSNASIDSHNFAADVIKWVDDNLVPWFRGKSFQTLATNAINSQQFNFAGRFNDALAAVNAQLRGPAQYMRVGLWARATRITIAFAPPEIAPPTNGSMSGVVRWDPNHTLKEDQGQPPGCTTIHMISSVRTGPAPLLDPDDYSNLGNAPTRQIGSFSASAAGDVCSYTLTGMSAAWPNTVTAKMDGGTHGSGLVTTAFALYPDGWKDPVVPNPGAPDHNFVVTLQVGGTASEVDVQRRLRHPADPVIKSITDPMSNPANIRTQPAAVTVTPESTAVQPPAARVVTAPAIVPTQPAPLVTKPAGAPSAATQRAAVPAQPAVMTPSSTLSRGAAPVSGGANASTVSVPQSTLSH
jgi:hypothetical protein